MGSFWRSLNLKLVLLTYIILLHIVLSSIRYHYASNSTPILAADFFRDVEFESKIFFLVPERELTRILLDFMQPMMLYLFVVKLNKKWFLLGIPLLVLFSLEVDPQFMSVNSIEGGELVEDVCQIPTDLMINLRYNFLSRLAFFYQILVLLLIFGIFCQDAMRRFTDRTSPLGFHISLGDLLVTTLLIAVAVVLIR